MTFQYITSKEFGKGSSHECQNPFSFPCVTVQPVCCQRGQAVKMLTNLALCIFRCEGEKPSTHIGLAMGTRVATFYEAELVKAKRLMF